MAGVTKYAVIADPRGATIDIDDSVDAILCTGDLLDVVPPPDETVDGSLYEEVFGHEGYDEKDIETIAANAKKLYEEKSETLRSRYAVFFDEIEDDFYTVYGNLDDPSVLKEYAGSGFHPPNDLEEVSGIDGVIPEVAGTPEGMFPTEISEEQFYREAKQKEGDILIAHTVPAEFTPEEFGFEQVYCSAGEQGAEAEDVNYLPSYKTTNYYEVVELP